MCTVCATWDLIGDTPCEIRDGLDQDWYISIGSKSIILKSQGFLNQVRRNLTIAEIPTTNPDGTNRYGTHSFRRGGAQALAKAGWTADMVLRWGRWQSLAANRYVQDTMIDSLAPDVGQAMMSSRCRRMLQGGHQDVKEPEKQPVAFEGRLPRVGDTLSVHNGVGRPWIRMIVKLRPDSMRPDKLQDAVPEWPLSNTEYLVCLEGPARKQNFRVIDVNDILRWMYATNVTSFQKDRIKTRRGLNQREKRGKTLPNAQ